MPLPLLLLVLNVGADHPDRTFAADDLAVFTNALNAASNLHRLLTSADVKSGESLLIFCP